MTDSDATSSTRTGVTASQQAAQPIPLRSIFQTWWPLATSWLLMSIELPLVSAVLARLAEPRISLAAYGGVVFPISLLIESPIIMLLAASTTLSRDWASYLLVRRFMVGAALALTAIHAAVAFTPLFDLVVGRWIGAPAEIQPAARIGLQIMTPWTASIAYRRFHHGVLIRFGHSRAVGSGTLKKGVGSRIAGRWEREANKTRAVLRPKNPEMYRAQMAMVGIAVKTVKPEADA